MRQVHPDRWPATTGYRTSSQKAMLPGSDRVNPTASILACVAFSLLSSRP